MTKEEAIRHFEEQAKCNYAPTREAVQMAVAALRAQPAKLDRNRREGCVVCNRCGVNGSNKLLCGGVEAKYCPFCGKPLTIELITAKDEKRLEALPPNDPLPLEELQGMDGEPVSAPMRFCSFSPNRICRKMAGNGVQPLHNYTCRFRPSSLKQADKSGLDGLQTGKSDSG